MTDGNETTGTVSSIGTYFNQMKGIASNSGASIKNDIDTALKQDDLDPMEMLDLQFKMGQFNALVEATSSVTKGLVDTAKTLAQRAGG